MDFEIINPSSTTELLETVENLKDSKYKFGAGCTDLLMELKKNCEVDLTIINLAKVKDTAFTNIIKTSESYNLGAMVTASNIIENNDLKNCFLVLYEAANSLASTQIRNVATIGGNLCTASPSGDVACALVALNSNCELLNTSNNKRTVPITDFFIGPRKTVIKNNELLYSISVPANNINCNKIHSAFIKIGTRRSMECSVVSLAYHIQINHNDVIINAGIAIGASSPTIRFTKDACNFLIGKKFGNITKIEKEEFAGLVLKYAEPISDIRASAWYRKEVLFNISKSIFE